MAKIGNVNIRDPVQEHHTPRHQPTHIRRTHTMCKHVFMRAAGMGKSLVLYL